MPSSRRFLPRPGALAMIALAGLAVSACRQDMHDQPKLEPYEASEMFADRQGSRPLVEGTVPRGFLNADTLLHTGKVDGEPVDRFPFPVTRQTLERGQERFNAFCSPCHGRTGRGNGMVVQRGFRPPPSFHEQRIRTQPVGYYFDVMTNGFGAMLDYRAQVSVEDRWAIAAYMRVLQYSQRAPLSDVPEADRPLLDGPPPAAAAPAPGAGH